MQRRDEGRPRTVVLTGGAHSGKTTLIRAFERNGLRVVPEAAMQVIGELTNELGTDGQNRWKETHRTEFQGRVARLQHQLEARIEGRPDEVVLLDRGLLDGIAFCRAHGVPLPPDLHGVGTGPRYHGVFLLDTLQPFSERTETGRRDAYSGSIAIRDLLHTVYTEHGYRPVFVAQASLEERIAFIRSRLP